MDFPTVAGSIKNINRDLIKCEMVSPQKLGQALPFSCYTTDELAILLWPGKAAACWQKWLLTEPHQMRCRHNPRQSSATVNQGQPGA